MMSSHSVVASTMTQRAALRPPHHARGSMARHRVASSSSSASVSSRTRRAGAVRVSAALGDIERARGQDYASAAECFVEAFFLARRSKSATEITKGELAYLNGAQKKDMVSRYNQRGLGTMLVIKDDEMRGAVVACVGVEVQTFKGTVPLRRAEENSKGEVMDRPVIANLATAPSARRKGLAKKLMRAVEEQCVEWGFEEAVLVVEANNSKARGLYKKLGYKAIGSEGDTPNLVVSDQGKVVNATVKTVFMRKSLKGGVQGALENVDIVSVAGVVGAGAAAVAAAAKFGADGGAF